MKKIIKISNKDIIASFLTNTRQYFVGDLKKPQEIDFIKDENLEVGITKYTEFTIEDPHKHSNAVEYQYVIEGYTEYLDIETMEEYRFEKGDFYAINKNTSYAQKSSANTQILFIKVPSINDKINLNISEDVKKWYSKKI